MKLELLLESLIWAFAFCLLAPIAGGTVMLLSTDPYAQLGLLYAIAMLYYRVRDGQLAEPGLPGLRPVQLPTLNPARRPR